MVAPFSYDGGQNRAATQGRPYSQIDFYTRSRDRLMCASGSSAGYRDWLWSRRYLFAFVLLLALAFRLWIAIHFAHAAGDTVGYDALAENLIRHHIFSWDAPPNLRPTDARAPGYPFFLGSIYLVAGLKNHTAVRIIQALLDTSLLFWLTWLAWEILPAAALPVLFLTAFEPYTAEYAASILTETCTIVLTAAALLAMLIGYRRQSRAAWFFCGLAIAAALLCRPDSVLLLASAAIFWLALLRKSTAFAWHSALFMLFGMMLLWTPWIVRNAISLHRFQPLANFYASQPDEAPSVGFIRWTRTWIADDRYLDSVCWRVDEGPLDINVIPSSAFDNEGERTEVKDLIARYNDIGEMIPNLDRQFGQIADQRISRYPLRYFVWLPLRRALVLWFSPHYRVFPLTEELLPLSNLVDDPAESVWIDLMFLFKLELVILACAGLVLLPDRLISVWAAGAILLRTAVFSWMPNVEYRYVLEVFPLVLVMGVVGSILLLERRKRT